MLIGSFIAMGVYGITTLQVSSRHPCSAKHAPLLPPRIMHWCISRRSVCRYLYSILQTYFYFLYYPKDGTSIKWLVGFELSSDSRELKFLQVGMTWCVARARRRSDRNQRYHSGLWTRFMSPSVSVFLSILFDDSCTICLLQCAMPSIITLWVRCTQS